MYLLAHLYSKYAAQSLSSAGINQALTAMPTWYQVFTNVAVSDLNMYFLNSAADQQEIYLHELVVDYA